MKIGETYLFHTHLGIWLGRVNYITVDEVVIDEASWVPDQGRMGPSVREGSLKEVEFVGDGIEVPRHAIKVPWRHPLPKEDK
jgi:hypothetical protein